MAYDVEDKVVQMRFDNRDFTPNIEASIKSLEKLERSLQMTNGTKGFENIEKSAKSFNINPAVMAVEKLKTGFSALQVVGITALQNLTNKAMAFGDKVVNAFAIAPLSSGWSEYSEQMNSTQVIMSNTGDSLAKITENLDELNDYADRTIYSFGQMTQAIGKFAAAGVELKDATKAIKGLSSAAATVGANNQQLFSAYYNLAQSLQLGYVQLIDWKSLENSTIGNKTMREAFIKTAIEMGKFTEASEQAQAAYSDFRGSLQKKWLTTDVVLTTLQKYSRALKEEKGIYYEWNEETRTLGPALKEIKDAAGNVTGYVSEAYGELSKWEVELGVTAYKSATEIKSFQQMWDTLTEAAGTGWAETWKIIFGDLEKAKVLWTSVSNSIESVITSFTDMRNNALKMWASWGGQEDLVETIKSLANIFANVGNTIARSINLLTGSIEEVGDETEDTTKNVGLALASITRKIRKFVSAIEKGTDRIKENAQLLAKILTPLKWIAKLLGFIIKVLMSAVLILDALIKTIINIIINIKDFPQLIKEIFGNAGWEVLSKILNGILIVLKLIYSVGAVVVSVVGEIINGIKIFNEETGIGTKILDGLKAVINAVVEGLMLFADTLGNGLLNLSQMIKGSKQFKNIFNGIKGIIESDFVGGIISGFKEGSTTIISGAKGIGATIISALKTSLEIHSPSRKGAEIGDYFVEGVSNGIVKSLDKVKMATSKMGDAIVDGSEKSLSSKGITRTHSATDKLKDAAKKIKSRMADIQNTADQVGSTAEKTESKVGSIFETIKEHIVNFGKDISDFYQNTLKPIIMNINFGKILAIGFSVAIIAFIFSIASLVDDVGGMIGKLGTSVISLTSSIANMADGVVTNLKAMAAETRSKAFEHISDSIFTIAKALALLTLVAAWNPEGLKQSAIILGIFAGSIALVVAAFTILYNKIQQLKTIGDAKKAMQQFVDMGKTMVRMFSVASMIIAISLAMAMMTKAIATLSTIDIKSALKGLAIVEAMMFSLVAMVFILSKFTPQLTRGTLLMFGFSYAMRLFTNAMNSIGGDLESGIQRLTNMSWQTYVKLVALIGVLTAASFAISKAQVTISKAIVSLSLLAIAIGIMSFMIGKVKESSEYAAKVLSFLASGGALAQMLVLIGAFTAVILILSKNSEKIRDVIKRSDICKLLSALGGIMIKMTIAFLGFIGGAAILISVLSDAATKLSPEQFSGVVGTSIGLMALTYAFMAAFMVILKKISSSKSINKESVSMFGKLNWMMSAISIMMMSLTGSMLLIMTYMSNFWAKYSGNNAGQGLLVLGSALGSLGILCGIIGGFIAMIGLSLKNDGGKHILKVLIPTIFLIGELMGSIAILSLLADDTDSYWMAITGIAAVMGMISILIFAIGTLKSDVESNLANGSKSKKTFDGMFKILVTIMSGIALIIGEMGALTVILHNTNGYDALTGVLATFASVMLALTWFTILIAQESDRLSKANAKSFVGLGVIFGGIIGLVSAMGAVAYIISRTNLNFTEIISILGGISVVLAVALIGVTNILKWYGTQNFDFSSLIYVVTLLTSMGGLAAALSGMIYILRGIPTEDFIGKISFLTMGVAGMTGLLIAITRWTGIAGDIKKVLPILGVLSAVLMTFGGVIALTSNVDALSFAGKMSGLVLAALLLSKLALALAEASNMQINKANLSMLIAAIGAIASIIPIFASSIAILSSLNYDNFWKMMGAMVIMSAVFVGMEATFGVLANALQKIPVQYIGLAIAVLGGITLAMIAFAGAVTMLAYAPLDELAINLALLWDQGGKMAAVGGAFVGLGLGMIVLGAGALLCTVSLLPFTLAVLGVSAAVNLLAQSAPGFQAFIAAINSLSIKSIFVFTTFMAILTWFSPFIVIISGALTILSASTTMFSLGLSALVLILSDASTKIVGVVQGLSEAGYIVAKNIGALGVLNSALQALSYTLIMLSPGLFAVSMSLSLMIVAFGAALGLATPFMLALGLTLSALSAIILSFKDASIALMDALLEKLPMIVDTLKTLGFAVPIMNSVGQALISLGLGFITMGVGGVLGALGILALCGAVKVLQLTLTNIFGDTEAITKAFDKLLSTAGPMALFGLALIVLGRGLIWLGLGGIAGALGILAMAGAIKVFNDTIVGVVGPADNLEQAFLRLWACGGYIAALGPAFISLGAGLIVFGVGAIVTGIGMTMISSAIMGVVTTISIFTLTLALLVNAISGCFASMTLFSMSLTNLANAGSLIVTGIGLMFVAAGFTAVAAAGFLLTPVLPIVMAVVGVMANITRIVVILGGAMILFSTKIEIASISVGNAMINMAQSFVTAIAVIKQGFASLANMNNLGTSVATNVTRGFANGMAKSVPVFRRTALGAAVAVQTGFTDPLEIHSPSEWFEWAGKMCSTGFDKSIAGEMPSFFSAGSDAADGVQKGFLSGIKEGFSQTKVGKVVGSVYDVVTGKKSIGEVTDKLIGENSFLGGLKDSLSSIWSTDTFNFLDGDDVSTTEDAASATDDYASALANAGSAGGSTKGTIESLTDTLKNQMNIFERFTADEEIMNPKELINNMKSQLRGMQNWANGIDMLAMRGISGPLLQYLAEMGPEGYKYVEAFLEMTGEEFEQANELYTQSLEMPESVAKQIGNSYERVGVEIIESSNATSGAIISQTDETSDHISETTEKTVNNLSSAVIKGVKFTQDELTKLMLEYDKDQEVIYFKTADALGNITEHIMSTHEFGAWRASNYAANIIDETHFNMAEMFSGSALGSGAIDKSAIQEAAEKYTGTEMLYYVDSVKKFYTRDQYAEFRKSCQDKNVEVFSITADQLNDIEHNYAGVVKDTSKTTQNAIEDTTDDVTKTVGAVGDAAGVSVTEAFEDNVNKWLDTRASWLGTTWREKIAKEFSIDPSMVTANYDPAISEYMKRNGEEIKNAGKGKYYVNNLATAISKLSEEKAQEIMVHTVDGLWLNANDYLAECKKVGQLIGGSIYNGTAKELGIASPSKEYAEIARFSVLGFVQGITKNISLAENASENLGDATLDSLSEAIGAISSTFTEDMDTTPMIRPVLDLSNVYDGMTALDTTFSTSQARIAGRAYMTTYDDSVDRLEDAYKKAIMDGNVELANMLLNSDNTNVIVNVHLDTNAEGIFDIVKVENEKATRDSGVSPLMIARNGAIRASLA